MKHVFSRVKQFKAAILAVLIGLSILLTAFDWVGLGHIKDQVATVGWIGASLLVTEALFIAGIVCMAVGAGEDLAYVKNAPLRHWPKHLWALRKKGKVFGQRLLTNKWFVVGFWMNFVGAVGTSALLIIAVLMFAPYTGVGVVFVILIDLIATLGWRIPVELARRKVRKYGNQS